jgi:D-alanyl-D-alanine carboxypeptidase (penicillin-binding protein 5/6)
MHRLFVSVFFAFQLLSVQANAQIDITPAAPQVNAKGYLLIDVNSGQVLVEKNADERLPPASLTKLMTSYVLSYELEKGSVSNDDMVLVSENAWAKKFPGSSLMWIEVGEEVSLGDLHKGIVISSGNDASVAVAEHLAGTEEAFADVMNTHAAALGMNDSHFVNSHGLPDPNHYTTARDLAIMAKAILAFPEEYALYSEKEFTYNNIRQPNRNELLWRDSSVDGLKTGYTKEAGYCLVSSAEREGMRLISVVMGAKSTKARVRETQKLLAYGFRYFETHKMYAAGEKVHTAKVWEGESEAIELGIAEEVYLTIPKGKHNALKINVALDGGDDLTAPVIKGDRYGRLSVTLGEETLMEADLIALADVAEAGFFARMWDKLRRQSNGLRGDEEGE